MNTQSEFNNHLFIREFQLFKYDLSSEFFNYEKLN